MKIYIVNQENKKIEVSEIKSIRKEDNGEERYIWDRKEKRLLKI